MGYVSLMVSGCCFPDIEYLISALFWESGDRFNSPLNPGIRSAFIRVMPSRRHCSTMRFFLKTTVFTSVKPPFLQNNPKRYGFSQGISGGLFEHKKCNALSYTGSSHCYRRNIYLSYLRSSTYNRSLVGSGRGSTPG